MMNQSLNSREISSRFDVERILGEGAFATVYKASTKIRAEDLGIECLNYKCSSHKKSHHYSKYDDAEAQSHCNRRQSHHSRIVSLKIVDVSKIAKRRSERNKSDEGEKGQAVGNTRKDCINHRKNNEVCEATSSVYDTEQLFFPSRIVDKAKTTNCMLRDDCDNGEYFRIMKMLQREISVHLSVSKYRHPNVLSMLESLEYNIPGISGKDLIVAMVMEYCPFGDLNQYLKRKRDEQRAQLIKSNLLGDDEYNRRSKSTLLDEKEIQHAMRHILRGLAFLHSRGIVHRDIKAGNILLSMPPSSERVLPYGKDDTNHSTYNQTSFTLFDCCLKIGDFGLAVQMSDDDDWDDAQHTLCGTPSCLAPEVALSTPQPSKERIMITKNKYYPQEEANEDIRGHGQPADLWSVGCLLYVMLVGRYPFSLSGTPRRSEDAQNIVPCKLIKMQETLKRVVQGDWSLPRNISLSEHAAKLLSQLLSYDPPKRGFARGLLSTHPFFKEFKDPIAQTGHEEMIIPRGSNLSQKSLLTSDSEGSARNDSHIHLFNLKQKSYRTPLCEKANYQQNQSRETGYAKEHANEHPQRCNERNTTSQFTSFVNPIKNIHQLPATKHQWESRNMTREAKKIIYTVYVLPAGKGIVFECEKLGGSGAWMHVTGDGEEVCTGKLSRKPIHPFQLNEKSLLYHEAFSRRPKKFKDIQDTQNRHVKYNEVQSMCTMGPLHSTICSTPSINSVPVSAYENVTNMKYKKLSSLLQKKNRTFFLLYRKLSKVVRELIRRNAPKVFLSIHECKNIKSNSTETCTLTLLCTVELVDQPKPMVTVTFVDGFTLQYDLSSGFAKINVGALDGKSDEGAINIFLRKNILSQIKGKAKVEFYYPYIQFAKSAIKKIIEIEREFTFELKAKENSMDTSSNTIPRRRKLVVQGKSFKSWIDITGMDIFNTRNDQKDIIEFSRLSRVLIEDNGNG